MSTYEYLRAWLAYFWLIEITRIKHTSAWRIATGSVERARRRR